MWRGLIEACPHGCRVHLTGGEAFLRYDLLLSICRQARQQGLGPLEKVETNGFWATDEKLVRQRVFELDQAGMGKLAISADPYHQQFVPIERCRLLARVAGEILGEERVQVRWRDWLEHGQNTADMPEDQRTACFSQYAQQGRDRLGGRAANVLAPLMQLKTVEQLADAQCAQTLLRSKGVHVDPHGSIMPGTCAGIILGLLSESCSITGLWQDLESSCNTRPVVSTLATQGPVGLMRLAQKHGFVAREGYAGRCHLCWEVRHFLFRMQLFPDELGPPEVYDLPEHESIRR